MPLLREKLVVVVVVGGSKKKKSASHTKHKFFTHGEDNISCLHTQNINFSLMEKIIFRVTSGEERECVQEHKYAYVSVKFNDLGFARRHLYILYRPFWKKISSSN